MHDQFKIYVVDTETTGTNPLGEHEVLEISFYRIYDNTQKTWYLKPEQPGKASPDALRINGHKIEDIKWLTKEGKEKYQESNKVIVDIENWFMEDGATPDKRIVVAHNCIFDLTFLQELWKRNNAIETFPFGDRPFALDTRQIQLFIDLVSGEKSEYYNLGSLVEKYKVKKEKAHSASTDTRMCKDVFLEQCKLFMKQ